MFLLSANKITVLSKQVEKREIMNELPLDLLRSASTIAVAHDFSQNQQEELLNTMRSIALSANAIIAEQHSATLSEERLELCTAVNEWQTNSRNNLERFKRAFIITGSRETTRHRHDAFNQFDSSVEKLLIYGRSNNTVTIIDSNTLKLPYRYNITLLFLLLPHRNVEVLFRTWLRPFFVDFASFSRVLDDAQHQGCIVFDMSFNGNRNIYQFSNSIPQTESFTEQDWESFTELKEKQDEDENDLCSICLEPYKKGVIQRVLRCRHMFHKQCIDTCVERQNFRCVVCSQPIRTAIDRHRSIN